MRYHVTLGDLTLRVERTAAGIRIDGRELAFEADPLGPDGVLLRFGARSDRVSGQRVEGGWRIRIGGREVVVQVEDERARAIREITGDQSTDRTTDLRAPMPGRVIKVLAEPGQTVGAGDGLIVVEAMKMENELRAEASGTIASVEVSDEGATGPLSPPRHRGRAGPTHVCRAHPA